MSNQFGLLSECRFERGLQRFVPVPLTGVSVDAQIIDLVAQVTVTQTYVNRESQPIEAIYLFPLDEGAGVCEFTAELEGRVIVGKVKKTEEAQIDYNHAIRRGQSAFLLEEKLPDVFKAKVGNLAPGSGVKIKSTYVTELKVEPDGDIRFYLPTTVAPRYIPDNDSSAAATDLASVNYTLESLYNIEFQATIKTGSPIEEIRSPTHEIIVNVQADSPNQGRFTLKNIVNRMDRDLVICIKVKDPNKPRLIYQKSDNGTGAMMLSLVPSFKLADQKTELIFIVDRSGSMMGKGIQQAKQALLLFLHSLPVDCYFNIVGFGSTYQPLFPTSQKYDGESLHVAKSHAASLYADLGGTEIYQPLSWSLNLPPVDGYWRQIFILTDGEVSNADQVISLIRQKSGRSRVFALGLGVSASHYLVEGMARAGNGTALFASFDERLENKVLQQLQDSLQPALTDVKVQWEGYTEKDLERITSAGPVLKKKTLLGYGKPINSSGASDTALLRQAPGPSKIPPVFDGRSLVVYALLRENARVPKWVDVQATSPDGPLSLPIDLDAKNLENGNIIQRLAAKRLIQLLQDKNEGMRISEEDKKEIIDLACEYGLSSRFTSYIAIDTKHNEVLKESWMMMKTRDVPLELAYGWGGFATNSAPVNFALQCDGIGHSSSPPKFPKMNLMNSVGVNRMSSYECEEESDGPPCESSVPQYSSTRADQAQQSDDAKLIALISLQNFDGSYCFSATLAKYLNSTVEELKERKIRLNVHEDVWATALVLAFSKLVLEDYKDSWFLVAKKADKWLASKNHSAILKAEAEKLVKDQLHLQSGSI